MPHGPAQLPARGFTLVELVIVIVLLGILAVAALPRLGAVDAITTAAFRDEAVAALRHAQKTAVAHRRLVCAEFTASRVTLKVAASHPASDCGSTVLIGPNGEGPYAESRDPARVRFDPVPASLHFQPSGQVTQDAAGTAPADFSLKIAGMPDILIIGRTGHVR